MTAKSFMKTLQDIVKKDPGITSDAQCVGQIGWMVYLKVYDACEFRWKALNPDFNSIIPENLRWRTWTEADAMPEDTLREFIDDDLFPGLRNLPVKPDTHRKQAIVRTIFEHLTPHMKDSSLIRQALDVLNEMDLHDAKQYKVFCDEYEKFLNGIQSIPELGWSYTPSAVSDFIVSCLRVHPKSLVTDLTAGTCGPLISSLNAKLLRAKKDSERTLSYLKLYGAERNPVAYVLGATNLLLHGVDTPKLYQGSAIASNVRDKKLGQFFVVLAKPPLDGVETDEVMSGFPVELRSNATADLFVAAATYRMMPGSKAAVIVPDRFLSSTEEPVVAIKKRLLEKFKLNAIIRLPGSIFAPATASPANILFFHWGNGKTNKTWFYRLDIPEGYKHFTRTKPILRKHFESLEEWWKNHHDIQDESADTFKAKMYKREELIARGYNFDLCGYTQKR